MQKLIRDLVQKNSTKIVMIVLDGLGGLPMQGNTELEAASTPHMDALSKISACGLHIPVAHGITPGSAPGHLALFGYDPLEYRIGRGILESLGLGMEVKDTDVSIRCNYATIKNGVIQNRRAGRIPTEQNRKLTEKLQNHIKSIHGAEISFAPGLEHRFAIRIRFSETLKQDASSINDSDPQKEGKPPLKLVARSKTAEQVVTVADTIITKAAELLKDETQANYILMRGFSVMPALVAFSEAYGLHALAIANYPMYRGIAKLIGMSAPDITGDVKDEIELLTEQYENFDFFFLHVKKIDSHGEDGNFHGKAARIEEFDQCMPQVLKLAPDVLIITGDHSTPASLKEHSWHPVPVMLKSPYVLGGLCTSFSERECLKGELGCFHTVNLMSLALANSGRLKKFGA